MRIYLDACSLQRPLDDRSQARVNMEAEAVLTILQLVEAGTLQLLTSGVLDFEIDQIPDAERQSRAYDMLKLASEVIEMSNVIQTDAQAFHRSGLKPVDALHLAVASNAKADYFCTCDDQLLNKSKRIKSLNTIVVSPLELIAEVAP